MLSQEDLMVMSEIKGKGKEFEDFLEDYVEKVYNNLSKEDIKKLEVKEELEREKKKRKQEAFEEFLN